MAYFQDYTIHMCSTRSSPLMCLSLYYLHVQRDVAPGLGIVVVELGGGGRLEGYRHNEGSFVEDSKGWREWDNEAEGSLERGSHDDSSFEGGNTALRTGSRYLGQAGWNQSGSISNE